MGGAVHLKGEEGGECDGLIYYRQTYGEEGLTVPRP
jgi:hypothetical protein